MTTATVRDITVAYDDFGTGDDVLVLIHGHPFDRSMWRAQAAAAAAAGWRVIVPDLRGYGETTVVPGTTTLDVFAADIAALLDHLGIGRVALGGLSMGGQIVMQVCRDVPERVRGLLLAATSPLPETEDGKRARRAMAERLRQEGLAPYADEVLAKMVAPRNIAAMPEVAAYVDGMMKRAHPEGAAAALRGRADRPDYRETLAALDVPGLVVVGDEDGFTGRADADLMHQLLQGSELVWMKGVAHMPNLERPTAFDEALLRFLDRVRTIAAA